MTQRYLVEIIGKDKTNKAFQQVQGNVEKTKQSVVNLKNALISLGVGAVLKSFVDVGKEAESLQTRFKFLFGSVEEGAIALDNLTKFASKVPFSLDQISRASGNLAVVAKDADDLNRILEITGNVAAVTGLDFETTASQIQRSFSGGIASADIFRERGVRALLGFKQGATITAEETVRRFEELFSGDGEFASATKDLAQTLEGTLSMLGDKYFKFQKDVASGFFDELKSEFNSLDTFLQEYENEISDIGRGLGGILAQSIRTVGGAIRFINENIEIFKALGLGALAFGATKAFISLGTALATATSNLISFNAIFSRNFIGVLVAGGVVLAKFSGLLDKVFGQEGEDDIQTYTSRLATLNIQLLGVKDTLQKTNTDDVLTDFQKISEAGNSILKNIEPLKDEIREEIKALKQQKRLIEDIEKSTGRTADIEFFGGDLLEKYGIETLEDFQDAIILAEADLLNLDQQTAQFIETLRNVPFGEIQIGFGEMEESFKSLREAVASFDKGFQGAMTKAIETNDDFEKFGAKAFDGFADTLTDALMTGKASFKDFARSLLADLLRIIIRQRIALTLQKAFQIGSGISSGGGIIGSIGKVLGFANGGTPPVNRPSIIGERGPELFVPKSSGTVVPNEDLKGISGTTNINFTINTVDARGVDELLTNRRSTIINVINDALNRQGKEALV